VKESKLVREFVKVGALEEKLPEVAKRCRLSQPECRRMLKLKRVQDALNAIMEPVRITTEAQRLVSEQLAQVTAKQEAENEALRRENHSLATVPRMRAVGNAEAIEIELMRVAFGLDERVHGRIKAEYLKIVAVISGAIEVGNMRGSVPSPQGGGAANVYASVFDRMRNERQPQTIEAVADDQEPRDILPVAPQAPKPVQGVTIPLPGESIDPAPAARQQGRVITVEVG